MLSNREGLGGGGVWGLSTFRGLSKGESGGESFI